MVFAASTKRSHECWSSSAGVLGGVDSIHRQASTSPVRPSMAAVLATPAPPPASPSSSNLSVRKKLVSHSSRLIVSSDLFERNGMN